MEIGRERMVSLLRERVSKIRKFLLKVLLVVCIGNGLFVLWNGLLEEVIPHSRTWFSSYNVFREETERSAFQKEQPASAYDIRYYVYEGCLEDKSGYGVVFASEDYIEAQRERIEQYSHAPGENTYYFEEGQEKRYVELKHMEEHRIDFLDKVLETENIGQFYFLCDSLYESSEIYNYDGVICNDETFEMVEFSYYGPLGNTAKTYDENALIIKNVLIGTLFLGGIGFVIFVIAFLRKPQWEGRKGQDEQM